MWCLQITGFLELSSKDKHWLIGLKGLINAAVIDLQQSTHQQHCTLYVKCHGIVRIVNRSNQTCLLQLTQILWQLTITMANFEDK